jgi:hypothetical protein
MTLGLEQFVLEAISRFSGSGAGGSHSGKYKSADLID